MKKMFAIVGEQRSGTIALGAMLDSHPDIHVYGEVFLNFRGGGANYFEFLQHRLSVEPDCLFPEFFVIRKNLKAFFEDLSGNRSEVIIGIHIKYDQFLYVPLLMRHLAELGVSVIHNIRPNVFDTVFSQIALVERQKQKLAAHTELDAVERRVRFSIPQPLEFLGRIEGTRQRILTNRQVLRDVFSNCLETWYPDILDPLNNRDWQQIFSFLDVSPALPVVALKKSTSSPEEHVINIMDLVDLKRRLADVEYIVRRN